MLLCQVVLEKSYHLYKNKSLEYLAKDTPDLKLEA